MAVSLERDPWGWVHPFYKRRFFFDDMNDFFQPWTKPRFHNSMFDLSSPMRLTMTPRTIHNKGDKFEVKLDVQQFAPQELDVKLVNNQLVIEGKHEEKQDEHGFISRQFLRKYTLPSDIKLESLTCDLSSDGVLQISAPKQIEDKKEGNEKVIPITFTGQPALTSSESKDKKSIAAAAC